MRGFQDNSPGNGVTKGFRVLLQSSHFVMPPSNTTEAFWIGRRQPILNPKSGLPHTFENIPLSLHVELRKKSILELKAVSLYAALVTSLYFATAVGKQSPLESHEDRQRIADFLQEQKALQHNLLGSLR